LGQKNGKIRGQGIGFKMFGVLEPMQITAYTEEKKGLAVDISRLRLLTRCQDI
jgi:hypothetical protein